MAIVTLYKPDGTTDCVFEYAYNLLVQGSVLTFRWKEKPTSASSTQVKTSLPFKIEQNEDD